MKLTNVLATRLQALFPDEYKKIQKGKSMSRTGQSEALYYCAGFMDALLVKGYSSASSAYIDINVSCGRVDRLFKLTEETNPK